MDVNVYEGRFGEEELLFSFSQYEFDTAPNKGDFIFYKGETYKVMYVMHTVEYGEYAVFVRKAIEEDF